jgi:lipid-binding SYLF domain-containing protein
MINYNQRIIPGARLPVGFAFTLMLIGLLLSANSFAATAREINVSVDETLKQFSQQVAGGREFLKSAKGVLVFPRVIKAGFGIGGEYGEGALRIHGKTVAYYNIAGASFGFQLGAQARSVILAFMQQKALENFRNSSGWKAGVDGSVALVNVGAGKSLDTLDVRDPIVGFVFGTKGLMYNLTLEGTKITKLKK